MRVTAVVVVLVACCGYASQFVDRGWIPSDEGVIAQTAERVLRGEVPHRDFDELYTGGLTYLHAAGMAAFGVNLKTPRLILLGGFVAFLFAICGVALRVCRLPIALIVIVLATVWSVPNYFAGIPSWYNLFFATFGILALLMFLERRRWPWLVLAGLAGGLSVLIKIVGLFYIAGGLLFLVFLDHLDAATPDRRRGSRFWMLLAIPGAALVSTLLTMMLTSPTALDFLPLFLPAMAASIFVVAREYADGRGSIAERLRSLGSLVWPFLGGAAIPLVVFVSWYWQQGAVDELFEGMFVHPFRRITEETIGPFAVVTTGLAVPYWLVLTRRSKTRREWLVVAVTAFLLGLGLAFADRPAVYRGIWAVLRSLPLVAVSAGLAITASSTRLSMKQRAQIFLLVVIAALTSLIQFPYAAQVYFCYSAPLIAVAIGAILSAQTSAPLRVHACIAVFCVLFALAYVNRSYGWNMGAQFIRFDPDSRLELERGGSLKVIAHDKALYEDTVELIRQHVGDGTMYAGPVCPELYFLSGLPNPTRQVLDVLASRPEDEATLERVLGDARVRVAVINTTPMLSSALMRPGLVALLERRFPSSQQIGAFVVRW